MTLLFSGLSLSLCWFAHAAAAPVTTTVASAITTAAVAAESCNNGQLPVKTGGGICRPRFYMILFLVQQISGYCIKDKYFAGFCSDSVCRKNTYQRICVVSHRIAQSISCFNRFDGFSLCLRNINQIYQHATHRYQSCILIF